jgi:hypothetical protein
MTLFGVCGRPGEVALGRYAGVRNWNADADFDATERDALERLLLVRLLSGDTFTLADTPTELDCPDATHRLKITEPGATRNADTNLNSLTPLLLPARYAYLPTVLGEHMHLTVVLWRHPDAKLVNRRNRIDIHSSWFVLHRLMRFKCCFWGLRALPLWKTRRLAGKNSLENGACTSSNRNSNQKSQHEGPLPA